MYKQPNLFGIKYNYEIKLLLTEKGKDNEKEKKLRPKFNMTKTMKNQSRARKQIG